MLLNLYSNALKFTGREGKITFMIELIPGKDREDNDQVRISVTDNGLGIKRRD